MLSPAETLREIEGSYASLWRTLRLLTNERAAEACELPGWTRAELVTHLARNADANRGMAEGAIRGEVVRQYPGGAAQREEDIHAGRGRRAADVIADLERAQAALMQTWARMPEDAWERMTLALSGPRPAHAGVRSRWREIEIHHVDLGLGYGPEEWSKPFVAESLEATMSQLAARRRETVPLAVWCLESSDEGTRWYLVNGDDGAEIMPSIYKEGPGATVRGPSWALLAWVLGRRWLDDLPLEHEGDIELARGLPGWFPYL